MDSATRTPSRGSTIISFPPWMTIVGTLIPDTSSVVSHPSIALSWSLSPSGRSGFSGIGNVHPDASYSMKRSSVKQNALTTIARASIGATPFRTMSFIPDMIYSNLAGRLRYVDTSVSDFSLSG